MNSSKYLIVVVVILTSSLFTELSAKEKWWEKAIKAVTSSDVSEISNDEISNAFKEALQIGSETVVQQLGTAGGFNNDATIHIPLPNNLIKVKKLLTKVGMSGMVDDLELKLNMAAEAATPKAKELFISAISDMSFDDIQKIYNGPKDSATQYFKSKMSASLSTEMRPIVDESLNDVGAIQSFDNVMGKYKSLPYVPDVKSDLAEHVINKAMDGIFHYVAKEEAAIREDPLKQTTDLLKKVFSQ